MGPKSFYAVSGPGLHQERLSDADPVPISADTDFSASYKAPVPVRAQKSGQSKADEPHPREGFIKGAKAILQDQTTAPGC